MSLSNKNSKANKRLEALFDDGVFNELDALRDGSVICAFGYINGKGVYAFSQNFESDLGAITSAQCSKLINLYSLAEKTGSPVIGVYDSNGVSLSEGFDVINAYGSVVKASARLSGVVPQLSLICGACLGTSALIANMADVVIALSESDFYVAVPSDVTAEQSAKEGTVDIITETFEEAANKARELIRLLPSNNLEAGDVYDYNEPQFNAESILETVADSDSLTELKSEYANNVRTALCTVAGSTAGIIQLCGEKLCPACAYKAEAFIKLCDAYSIPIITIADSKGAAAEKENAQLTALTKLTSAYVSATCPKISVISNNSVGLAYIILAGKGSNADYTIAIENSFISPLEEDSAVAFLYSERLAKGEDRELLTLEYKNNCANAQAAAEKGAVDEICDVAQLRNRIINALDMLSGKREETLARKHTVK